LAGLVNFAPADLGGSIRPRSGRKPRFRGGCRFLSALVLVIVAYGGAASPGLAADPTFNIKDVDDATATKFKAEFQSRKETLERYLIDTSFAPVFSGPIDVEVSADGPSFSEALLFAWDGRRGHSYFPAARVKQGKAAITHELMHVNAPNEVRFLAEGFPTYVEDKIGNVKAYPLAGHHIACGIQAYDRIYTKALDAVNFVSFDATPTKHGLRLGDGMGLEPAFPKSKNGIEWRRDYAYLVSASFVKFLIEGYGLDKFKALYNLTPLTPGQSAKADPGRYQQSIGKPIDELQSEWRVWLPGQKRSCH